MSRITACPQCQTRFRVTEEQLQARGGKVRCGRCEHVFNALETLIEETPPLAAEAAPSQQTDTAEPDQEHLPAPETAITPGLEAQEDTAEAVPPEETGEEIPEALFELEITHPETPPEADDEPLFELELTQPEASAAAADVQPEHAPATSPEEETTLIEAAAPPTEPEALPEPESKAETRVVRIQPPPVTIQPKVSPERPKYAPPPKPRRAWPWVLANLLLLLGLAIQGIYAFRDAIAAHYPPTRPLLEQACAPLQCRVSLPRNPDLISIESSELHADPARASIVVLASVLRNRATHVQAYPTLELTLTNTKDEMVARKLFAPKEYLRNTAPIPRGIAPGSEVAVKLLLDLGDLKAEGYRLYLFYPSESNPG